MAKVRVLVVEDSAFMRKYLMHVLNHDPEVEVVGEAEDGKRAVELCERLRPDVVSLDMMLPVMNGLAATEKIMSTCPTPILVVSASFNRGEVFTTYDALSAGAVDVLEKPRSDRPAGRQWEEGYCRAIKLVSRIKVGTRPRVRPPAPLPRAAPAPPADAPRGPFRCVVIGASTGGPGAVAEVLKALPVDFPLPILAVIHISAPFGEGLNEWLDAVSPLRVYSPVDGQPLPGPAQVIVAPPSLHMVVRGKQIRLTTEPVDHFFRPSVDVLFESIAAEMGASVVGCLLTGMGSDGARGLMAIKKAGGMAIAQDEQSSVVFGMPQEAIRMGAVHRVLELTEIAPALIQLSRLKEGHRAL